MGTRTGNPDWAHDSDGGTPISAAALQNIEEAIDESARLENGKVPASQLPTPPTTEKPLIAGTNITIDRSNPDMPVISAAGGGGGGSGNAMFVYYTAGAWGARPNVTTPVIYVSTNDAAASRAVSMVNYDMWIRHPDALEAL